MELADETDLLCKIPMFAKLEMSKLKLLAFTSEVVCYADKETLFHAGDPADCAYVIMEGSIDIVSETSNGPIITSTLLANQLFGELGLLNNEARIATLVASSTLRVMKIEADIFLRLVRENSDVAFYVIHTLSERLARSHSRVERLQEELSQKQ
jgi:CRP/FNR family transcriptional regulator, cyclic AMP receptor protein